MGKAQKKKSGTPKGGAAAANFAGTMTRTISRDEIYHRLEWYFDRSHDPHGPHTIPPATPITALLHNVGLDVLYVSLSKASQMYVPAWNSQLFHGITIPWISEAGVAIGIKDVKTMGDLINSFVLSYKHAGWQVTEG